MADSPLKRASISRDGICARSQNGKHLMFLVVAMFTGLHMCLSAYRQAAGSKLAGAVVTMSSQLATEGSLPLAQSKLPALSFGVIMESEHFNYGVRLHSVTTVPQLVRTRSNILFSIPPGADKNFTDILHDEPQDSSGKLDLFPSRCSVSSQKYVCKTMELLRAMRDRNPATSWYFVARQFTLFFPERVSLLLRTLYADHPTIIGAPGLSNCSHAGICQHVSHSDVTWAHRTSVRKRLVDEAGFIISRSALSKVLKYYDESLFRTQSWNRSTESYSLLNMLRASVPNIKIIPAHSFFSRTGETELYVSALYRSSRLVHPVSFPYTGDVSFANVRYERIRSRPQDTDLVGERVLARPWSRHLCTATLEEMREEIATLYGKALKNVKEVAIIGIPEYENRGDSAIYMGQIHLLDELGVKVVYETDALRNLNTSKMMQSFQVQREYRLILMQGGGNFGNHYYFHHELRLQVMRSFPSERIVHFPNSICARDDSFWSETYETFSAHDAPILLVSRDWNSTEIFRRHLGNISHVTVAQSPDMVFYMNLDKLDFSRYSTDQVSTIDLLVHARADKESVAFDDLSRPTEVALLRNWNPHVALRKLADSPGNVLDSRLLQRIVSSLSSQTDDWIAADANYLSDKMTFRERAEARTVDGIMFLRRGKVVLTDRLHAHILLTLIQTPHVALDNVYKKISAFHNTYLSTCDIGIQRHNLVEGTAALVEILTKKHQNDSLKL